MKKLSISPVAAAAMLVVATPVLAQQDIAPPPYVPQYSADAAVEGFHPYATLGYEHDDNVLRTSTATTSDSDWQIGVGLKFDKHYSLQHIHGDVGYTTYRYQDHDELNYNTLNYNLAWDWSITPHFHGIASADRREYRDIQANPITFANDIGRRTEQNEVLEGTYDLGAAWRILGGVSHYKASSTLPITWDASPDITYGQAGVGYEWASGSSLIGRFRRGDGEYKDETFVPNTKFKDTQYDATFKWTLTGKTAVEARLGHLKREHDNSPQLDFAGAIGGVLVNWAATGKINVVAGYNRDLSGTGFVTGGKVTSDRLYISPVWQVTAKTSLNARYDHIDRKWSDIPAGGVSFGRKDTQEQYGIGADWNALRWMTVSAYLRRETLDTNLTGGYHATVYGLTAKATF